MTIRNVVAVDLGASSGRVMLARYQRDTGQIALQEIHRFANRRVMRGEYDCWDLDALELEIRAGLARLDAQGIDIDSIGIDTWGVDVVLLDQRGERVGETVSYRDGRTHGVMAQAEQQWGREALWQRTGIQFLPFNTLWQLRAFSQREPAQCARVAHALMIPDYLHYRFTGEMNWEYTNATTTQLMNIQSGEWDETLLAWAGANKSWFGKPTQPGNTVGYWQSASGKAVPMIAVASHDTASAVMAVPLEHSDTAWISSGTWSLMGFESPYAHTGAAALAANVTNEGGIEGRYRVLKNIMGMWLLQRICDELQVTDIAGLVSAAEAEPACRSLINPNDERFINPVSMVQAIQDACAEQGMPVPQSTAALARCIFDSLAMLYRQVLDQLTLLRGKPFSQLHIVGGGSQNHFLNQLCANHCNLAVQAGPVEASTLGNVGCQLIALGELADLQALRHCIAANFPVHTVQPHPEEHASTYWQRFQSLSQTTKELCL